MKTVVYPALVLHLFLLYCPLPIYTTWFTSSDFWFNVLGWLLSLCYPFIPGGNVIFSTTQSGCKTRDGCNPV